MFQVGKFYELYHMDAVIGVNCLGFSYMKGEFAHSGFPESAYGKMASSLIEQGFKVARVEQTETPEMMNERCKGKKNTKFDKVVKREICQISMKGTCIYGAQMTEAKHPLPCYMFAIAEKVCLLFVARPGNCVFSLNLFYNFQNIKGTTRFGVCFVDTSIGTFHLAEFDDDKHCSRLLALFAEHPPSLVSTLFSFSSVLLFLFLLFCSVSCALLHQSMFLLMVTFLTSSIHIFLSLRFINCASKPLLVILSFP